MTADEYVDKRIIELETEKKTKSDEVITSLLAELYRIKALMVNDLNTAVSQQFNNVKNIS